MHLLVPALLLIPHLHHRRQILIPRPLRLHKLQRLAQKLLHPHIPSLPKQILDRARELSVEVARKRMARVVDEDANQHDGIVVDGPGGGSWVGEELANAIGGFFGGVGAGFGAFDDGGEVDIIGIWLRSK